MVLATLGTIATKATVSGATIVGRKVLTKRQRDKIAAEAAGILVAGETDRFVEHLSEKQLRSFKVFAESAQFGDLVRQAMISSLANTKDETTSALREQVGHCLRHTGVFAEADLFQATDVVEELIYAAVHAVRQKSAPGTLDSGRAVAMAGRVAAAGVRNGELLAKVESLDEINKFARSVRAAAKTGYGKLRLATHNQRQPVEYSQLYVPADLRPTSTGPWWYPSTASTFSVADVAAHALRLVILGDPGAGKSTLTAKLAHDLATDKIPGLEGQVPVLLQVRMHTQSLRTEHETLVHYLAAACRRPANVEPPAEALEYLLLNGRMTVIIDGVDELGDSSYRQSFAQLVDSFANRYPLARVIVTSRIIGYADAALDDDLFPTVGISPFSRTQVTDYAKRWFRLDSSLDTDRCRQKTESFLHESEVAEDLRANPLILSLLCSLYSSVHYIPRNKPEIYEKCAELLFETWDRTRNIEVAYRYGAHIRPAVLRMAWKLFTDPRGRQALPRQELIVFLSQYMNKKRFDDTDEAEQAAADFLDFCAGRAWVLTDTGSDLIERQYGFVHRTFLEFFAASQLVKQHPDPQVVWSELEPHINNSSWEVVGQLAVQILDRNCEDGADRLLALVLEKAATGSDSGHLAFAARCLDNVSPDNETIRRVVTPIVMRACGASAKDRRLRTADSASHADAADGPLTYLLATTAPDNTERIARAICDALEHCTDAAPSASGAGIVYDALHRGIIDAHPLHVVNQHVSSGLALRVPPPAAADWRRLLHRPDPADLAERGLRTLFEPTRICGFTHRPLLMTVLASTLGCHNAALVDPDWIATLETYYPQVIRDAAWLDTVQLPAEIWRDSVGRINDRVLDSVSPAARATLILLALPVSQFIPSIDETAIGQFLGDARSGYRQAAGDRLNSWKLQSEAHEHLLKRIANW